MHVQESVKCKASQKNIKKEEKNRTPAPFAFTPSVVRRKEGKRRGERVVK